MVIRRAGVPDAAAMAEVWLKSFSAALPGVRRAHTAAEVRSWFREVVVPQLESWVAVVDGSVVGLVVLDGDWVSQLYVDPDWWQQGIGAQLLELAKRRRPAGLELWTFQVNGVARRFYEDRGFVEVERTDGAGNEEREPDIRYVWESGE